MNSVLLQPGKLLLPLMLVMAIAICVGCKRTSRSGRQIAPATQEETKAKEPRETTRAPTEAVATEVAGKPPTDSIPLDAVELPGNALVEEAGASTWASEEYAQTIGDLLNQLRPWIARLDAPQTATAFVDSNVAVGSLRPKTLSPVFQDTSFEVRRPANMDATPPRHGTESLRQELRLLGSDLDAKSVQLEQKVVSITIQQQGVTTRSLVHLSGQAPQGRLQINVGWECLWRQERDEFWLTSIRTTDYEEVLARGSLFSDCTLSVLGGTDYWRTILSRSTDYWLDRLETKYGLDPAAWHGMAIGDVNNDGFEDVYVCQAGGIPNGLLLQNPDGTVREVASAAGVDLYDQSQSALLVDLDNDGDQDLAVAISMGIALFANDGQGKFSAQTAKLMPEGMPYSLSAADYDADGDLDLYVCCYSKRKRELNHRFLGRPIPYHDANNGARNALLHNHGEWRFQDVTQRVGLSDNNNRFSFAASWEDYDNDGDLDLYVANDYGRNNLYRFDDGRFQDVASQAGVEDMSAGMSVSWGDVDNDGWMDLYVSNMFSSAGNRIAYQRQFKPGVDAVTLSGYQRHARGNSLFRNSGQGEFRDVSESAHVTMGRWAWGSTFVDLNNDGLKDLLVSNGFLTQDQPDDL